MRAVLKPDAEGISRPAYEQLKTMMVQATTVKLCMVVCDPTAARQLACFKAAPKFGTAVSNPPNASHVLVQIPKPVAHFIGVLGVLRLLHMLGLCAGCHLIQNGSFAARLCCCIACLILMDSGCKVKLCRCGASLLHATSALWLWALSKGHLQVHELAACCQAKARPWRQAIILIRAHGPHGHGWRLTVSVGVCWTQVGNIVALQVILILQDVA